MIMLKNYIFCALVMLTQVALAVKGKEPKFKRTEDGLNYAITLKSKQGKKVTKGDMVQVVYTSFVNDTVEIAKSDNREAPYEFVAGNGDVLKGLDAAVLLLKVGEKATL